MGPRSVCAGAAAWHACAEGLGPRAILAPDPPVKTARRTARSNPRQGVLTTQCEPWTSLDASPRPPEFQLCGLKGHGGVDGGTSCLLYTSPSPRDGLLS
eukprot:1433140-Pleurochrysis_carterae.AAC.2